MKIKDETIWKIKRKMTETKQNENKKSVHMTRKQKEKYIRGKEKMRWRKTFFEEIRQEMKRTARRGKKKKKVQNYLWPGSYEWIKKTYSTTTVGLF